MALFGGKSRKAGKNIAKYYKIGIILAGGQFKGHNQAMTALLDGTEKIL